MRNPADISIDGIRLSQSLQIAIFHRVPDGYRLLGELPAWWAISIGRVQENKIVTFSDPFLIDFLSQGPLPWDAFDEGVLASELFAVNAGNEDPEQLQALAVRTNGQNVLLVRNLNTIDTWLTHVLRKSRINMLAHVKDRSRHVKEVAEITADRDEAKRLERIKGEFLANMSHEIRTPLTTILGLVEMATREHTIESQLQYLPGIQEAARTLERLSNDILDLSRLQAERLELDEEPFSIPDLLDSFEQEWSVRAVQKNLDLSIHVKSDIAGHVRGDEFRLRQVLANLVGNALKFTDEGSVRITVTPLHSRCSFSVDDTGVGMSQKQLSRIFESFTQVDASARRRHQGAGLGLTIASNLVVLMGGELEVRSEVGRGSCFSFEIDLPCAERIGSVSSGTHETKRQEGSPPLRILVAEDHEINRMIIVDSLSAAGHEVIEVRDGQAAVNTWRAEPFDVVVMDCQMPVMSGLDAIRAIRDEEIHPHRIPIVALTAHAMREERQRLLDHGADQYLAKPFEREDLLSIVSAVARRS